MSPQEFEAFEELLQKSSSLAVALDMVCRITGTDWISSHTWRAIRELKATIDKCHGLGRELDS